MTTFERDPIARATSIAANRGAEVFANPSQRATASPLERRAEDHAVVRPYWRRDRRIGYWQLIVRLSASTKKLGGRWGPGVERSRSVAVTGSPVIVAVLVNGMNEQLAEPCWLVSLPRAATTV